MCRSKQPTEGNTEYQQQPLGHYIQPASFDEDRHCFVCRDDTIGFIFECSPKTLAKEDTVSALQGLYASPIIPEGTILQVMLWASDFIEPLVDAFKGLRKSPNETDEISSWADSISEILIGQKRHGSTPYVPVPIRNYRLIISIKLPYHASELQQKARKTDLIYRTIKSALETANLFPKTLDPEQYLRLMYPMLNPNQDRTTYPHYEKDCHIYQQLKNEDADTYIGQNYIKYDGVHGKAVTIRRYPEEVSITDTPYFLGDMQRNELQITCPHMITLTIYNAGSEILRGQITWWLYHDKLDTINKNAELLKALLDTRDYKLQEEIRSVNLALFLYGTLPLNANKDTDQVLKRSRTMFHFNAAHLSPVQSDWKGTGTPTVYFSSRRGQLQSFDFFDSSKNFNGIIAAMPGTGKTFLIQHIIYSYYSLPNISNIWAIDVGESNKALCNLLGGQHVDFMEDAQYIINPFSECDDLDKDMDLLIAILAKMAKPTEPITDTEGSVIEQSIGKTFARLGKDTNIDDIIDTLNDMQSHADNHDPETKQAIDTIATNLYRWGTKGRHGKYFNGRSNLNLQDKFVVLELRNVSHYVDLPIVILMVLFYHIYRIVRMENDPTKRKMIIIDEAWQFLHGEDPNVAKFLGKIYATTQKHNTSALTATWSIDDFHHNESTKALMTQASHWLILKQKPQSIDLLRKEKKIALTDYEFELLESVKTIHNLYIEIFFMTPSGNGVARLILPAFLYCLYTTDPKEVSKRQKLIEEHGFKGGMDKCVELYEKRP